MDQIAEILEEYIKWDKTDYSVLIDGKWGSGKTHFLKNKLIPHMEQLKNSEDEPYKVLYISLNGLSNINDLPKEIIAANLGIHEKGNMSKMLFSSSDFLLNSVGKLLKADDYIKDITKVDFTKFINFKNKILCFDDIERINSKLSLNELLGYIYRNFIEYDTIKVIIIGDVSKIEDQEAFKITNEKTFGRRIAFFYNYQEIFAILLERYDKESGFKELLQTHENLIVGLLSDNSLTNLRIVFFFMELLSKYYNTLHKTENVVWEQIILFTIIVSIEFKRGAFIDELESKRSELRSLATNFIYYRLLADKKRTKETSPSYGEQFAQKYLANRHNIYKYSDAIFVHVVNGYFEETKLIQEYSQVKEDNYIFALKDYELLEDCEFIEVHEALIDGIQKGRYDLFALVEIFILYKDIITQRLLSLSLIELKGKILNSILLIETNSEYWDEINLLSLESLKGNDEEVDCIISKIQDMHKEFLANKQKKSVQLIFQELRTKKANFYKNFPDYYNVTFSEYLSAEQVLIELSAATNHSFTKFFRFIENKYKNDNYRTIADITLLEGILDGLKIFSNETHHSRLRIVIYMKAQSKLEKVLIELKKERDRMSQIQNINEVKSPTQSDTPK